MLKLVNIILIKLLLNYYIIIKTKLRVPKTTQLQCSKNSENVRKLNNKKEKRKERKQIDAYAY